MHRSRKLFGNHRQCSRCRPIGIVLLTTRSWICLGRALAFLDGTALSPCQSSQAIKI